MSTGKSSKRSDSTPSVGSVPSDGRTELSATGPLPPSPVLSGSEAFIPDIQQRLNQASEELLRLKRLPTYRGGLMLVAAGAALLALSFFLILNPTALVFAGLGLVLWGAVLLYSRPVSYVRGDVASSSSSALLQVAERVITESPYKGRTVYLPPKGLEELVGGGTVLLERGSNNPRASNPEDGLVIPSPGSGLLTLCEKEMRVSFSAVTLGYIVARLPTLLVEDLGLAEDVSISPDGDLVKVNISKSIFRDCPTVQAKATPETLECPLCSMLGSVLAKVSRRQVVITERKSYLDGAEIELTFKLL